MDFIERILISPNPTTGALKIFIPMEITVNSIKIYDLTGRELLSLEISSENRNIEIDVSNFSSGMYNIHLISTTDDLVFKLIKK